MNKLSQAYNYHTLPKANKNQAAEQAKRERELQAEDDLFNRELARLGLGVVSDV